MKYLPLDTIRIILIVAAVIVVIDLYSKWEKVNEPIPAPQFDPFASSGTGESAPLASPPGIEPEGLPSPAESMSTDDPGLDIGIDPAQDSIPSAALVGEDQGVPSAPIDESAAAIRPDSEVSQRPNLLRLDTELVSMGISPIGGQLVHATMKKHAVELADPSRGYPVLSTEPVNYQVVQSGFISRNQEAPNHHAVYRPIGGAYSDDDGLTTSVALSYTNDKLRVRKLISLTHDNYIVNESYTISNIGDATISMRPYTQVSAQPRGLSGGTFIVSYAGGGYFSEDDDYRKLDYDTFVEKPLSLSVSSGWLAMIEHYFITAMVPPMLQDWQYYTKTISQSGRTRYLIGMYGQTLTLAPGAQAQLSMDYYIGPKHHDKLAVAHPELDQSIDYGVLSFLSTPMFWLLDFFHGWTNNWGWAIVLLTMVVRLLLYKPAEISFRSMARMREATPEIQRIREQYKDNREQMGLQMMEIYKKRKINPLSGCLPILLQIPVFIALYWMLLESIELRQTPWIFWIDDLSAPDPYYVLPILMGGFMVLQQKLNPAPLDPMQQKVFAAMPIVLGGISLFFPSGLVLYWTVNNALSILQQWIINKRVHEQEARKHA